MTSVIYSCQFLINTTLSQLALRKPFLNLTQVLLNGLTPYRRFIIVILLQFVYGVVYILIERHSKFFCRWVAFMLLCIVFMFLLHLFPNLAGVCLSVGNFSRMIDREMDRHSIIQKTACNGGVPVIQEGLQLRGTYNRRVSAVDECMQQRSG